MTIAASILMILAVLAGIYAGIFWVLANMMSDPVIHNRIMYSTDPTGFQNWVRHNPRTVTCYLTLCTGLLLVLALLAIC